MAFTYVVTKRPLPNDELAAVIAKLGRDERVEVMAESPDELRNLQTAMLNRMKGKLSTKMNGDGILYIWRK